MSLFEQRNGIKPKISLAGDLGSGKSTVSDILISALGAEYYATGRIVREIAERRGMTVVELNKYMETHPEIDHEIDNGLVALSDADKLLVIDSRMAWHFTRGTFKVYLSVNIETSALRIMSAKREGERSTDLDEAVRNTRERRDSERKRYLEQYGVDIKDLSNYDLIVDTTYASPDEVASRIISSFEQWWECGSFERVFVCPERLKYPDREYDEEKVRELSLAIELGAPVPMPEVAFRDGEFYLISELEAALAYSLSFSTFIEAKLVSADIPDCEYIEMKNSL